MDAIEAIVKLIEIVESDVLNGNGVSALVRLGRLKDKLANKVSNKKEK